MKKLLALVLTFPMMFMFASCGEKKTKIDGGIAGGWTLNTETDISGIDESIYTLFEAAAEKSEKEIYPVFYFGSRAHNGAEYAFLCVETDEDDTMSLAVAFVSLAPDADPEITKIRAVTLSEMTSLASEFDFGDGEWELNTSAAKGEFPELVKAACDKAFAGQSEYVYTPISYLGSQVVAGQNFLTICKVSRTGDAADTLALVTVFAGLDGNASILRKAGIDIEYFGK